MKLDQFIKFIKPVATRNVRNYANTFLVEEDKLIYTDGFFLLEVICVTGLPSGVYNLDLTPSQVTYPNYKQILMTKDSTAIKDCSALLNIADIICMNKKSKTGICIISTEGRVFAEDGIALHMLSKMVDVGCKGVFEYDGGWFIGEGEGVRFYVGMAKT